jgi:hypothetical protein
MFEEKIAAEPQSREGWDGQERRAVRRVRCWSGTFVLFIVRPSFRCFRVPLWDVSPAGISFLHDVLLPVDTVLALQVRAGLPGLSRVRTARVVHATPQGGIWRIGCQVSPPFSERELESL